MKEIDRSNSLPLDADSIRKPSREYDFEQSPPLGIDFGTTNSAIARWRNTIRMIGSQVYNLSDQDGYLMPSAVYLQNGGSRNEFIVGKEAYRRRISEPDHVAVSIKRRLSDSSKSILLADYNFFSSVDLTAEIVKSLFRSVLATGALRKPAGIVLAVPYYFKQNQNHNVKRAAEKALAEIEEYNQIPPDDRPKLLGLIPEPIAAALSYATDHMDLPIDQIILTLDMGGGTLDLTIFKLQITGSEIEFEVLATEGDEKFGGDDFDQILEDYLVEQNGIFYEGLSTKFQKKQRMILRQNAINTKERLTYNKQVGLYIPDLPCKITVDTVIKRSLFEELLDGSNSKGTDFGAAFNKLLDSLMGKAKINDSSISTILPIGGSAKIQYFRKILKARFPEAVLLEMKDTEFDTLFLSVAKGAAVYSAYLLDKASGSRYLPFEKKINFITRTSHNLGIKTRNDGFSVIVEENTIVPITRERTFAPIIPMEQDADAEDTNNPVQMPDIEVYQGGKKLASEGTLIGIIKIPAIYRHGRKTTDIKVHVTFQVDVTTLNVRTQIEQGDEFKKDIDIEKELHLEDPEEE